MTSETRIAYGSVVLRHGKSRAVWPNQAERSASIRAETRATVGAPVGPAYAKSGDAPMVKAQVCGDHTGIGGTDSMLSRTAGDTGPPVHHRLSNRGARRRTRAPVSGRGRV